MNTNYRIGVALLALVGTLALGAGGCNVGNEGERCNPSLSHDECGSGLACTQPAYCPENYCCPTSGTSSSDEWPPETSRAMTGAGSGPCSSWSTATCAARWLTPYSGLPSVSA